MPGYIHRHNFNSLNRKMPFLKSVPNGGFCLSFAEGSYGLAKYCYNNAYEGRALEEIAFGGKRKFKYPSPFGQATSTDYSDPFLFQDGATYGQRDSFKWADKSDYQFCFSMWLNSDIYSWRNFIVGYITSNYAGWGLMHENYGSGNLLTLKVKANHTYVVSAPLPSLDEWHHIAGSYDRYAQRLRLWVDGVEQTETTVDRSLDYVSDSVWSVVSTHNSSEPVPTNRVANVISFDGKTFSHSDVQMLYQGSSNLFKHENALNYIELAGLLKHAGMDGLGSYKFDSQLAGGLNA